MVYTRGSNPTIDAVDATIAELEGVNRSIAAACGIAAITPCYSAACGLAREYPLSFRLAESHENQPILVVTFDGVVYQRAYSRTIFVKLWLKRSRPHHGRAGGRQTWIAQAALAWELDIWIVERICCPLSHLRRGDSTVNGTGSRRGETPVIRRQFWTLFTRFNLPDK